MVIGRWLTAWSFALTAVLLTWVTVSSSHAADLQPRLNDGERWQIALYQGGNFVDYDDTLRAFIKALIKYGWLESRELPAQQATNDSASLWEWLGWAGSSRYLAFHRANFFSDDWDDAVRARTRLQLLKRLKAKQGIDLLIAMGTWAGQDVVNNEHSVPTLVASTSEPVLAGVIKSNEDSGFDHVHAHVDPQRYRRQLSLFYDFTRFKRLGLVFADTPRGRSYAGLADVQAVARAKGFDVEHCYVDGDSALQADADKAVLACYEQLARTTDAFYVTTHKGVNDNTIPHIADFAIKHGIFTFSQAGKNAVRQGILLGMDLESYDDVGEFHAQVLARVLHGESPRAISQVFAERRRISINLATASKIGFIPPALLLAGSDEFHDEVALPNRE